MHKGYDKIVCILYIACIGAVKPLHLGCGYFSPLSCF